MNGIDLLCLTMQDVDMIAANWPKGWALGILLGTFSRGDINEDFAAIEKILATGRCPAVRVHLIDWTCWRNKNAEPWQPRPETHRQVAGQRAQALQALADKHRSTKFFVSPLLEYDEPNRTKLAPIVATVRKYAPRCTLVLSPTSHAALLPGIAIERHGNDAHSDIVSNDGAQFWEVGPLWKGRGRLITFCWWPECNLRRFDEKHFIPPSKRPIENRVTKADIESCVLTMTKGNP